MEILVPLGLKAAREIPVQPELPELMVQMELTVLMETPERLVHKAIRAIQVLKAVKVTQVQQELRELMVPMEQTVLMATQEQLVLRV
jgi:hypothetical protein